jgi:hypothetical protein
MLLAGFRHTLVATNRHRTLVQRSSTASQTPRPLHVKRASYCIGDKLQCHLLKLDGRGVPGPQKSHRPWGVYAGVLGRKKRLGWPGAWLIAGTLPQPIYIAVVSIFADG